MREDVFVGCGYHINEDGTFSPLIRIGEDARVVLVKFLSSEEAHDYAQKHADEIMHRSGMIKKETMPVN